MLDNKLFKYIGDVSPVITEKALKNAEGSYVVFKSPVTATKSHIKKIISFLYKDVKVLKINSTIIKGKQKRFRGTLGNRSDYKKFFVKLDKTIDITIGVK